ncbi:PucR family transcriptional regulator [Desulfotomaculum copahuensis]|nr:PucR family transcriptional regulator [Desulfotomaculum copahuensis]
MPLTVGEALQLPVFSGARLLAGGEGLDSQVRWVNVVEVLDETTLLQPGELLLTTAYGLEPDHRLQSELIPELAGRGLAGLIIQVGHYLQAVPESMRRQAGGYRFPLIELPKNVSFAAVTQAVNRQIINRQIEQLEYAGRVHSRLIDLMLAGGGLPAIAETLSGLTGGAVTIVDPLFRLLAACPAGEGDNPAEAVRRQFQALARTGLLDVPALERKPLQVRKMAAHHIPDQYIFPVLAGDALLAYISVREEDGPPGETAVTAVGQAAALCALEMLKARAVRETENRLQGDFLDDLLAESPASPADIKRRALYFGYDMHKEQLIMLAGVDGFPQLAHDRPQTEVEDIKRKLAGAVEAAVQQTAHRVIYKYRHDTLILLAQLPAGSSKEQAAGLAARIQSRAAAFLPPLTVSIAIGQPCTALQELRRSYREAARTLEVIRATGRKNTVLHYRDLGIYRLLAKLKDDPELAAYYRSSLGPLVDYDRRHGTQLVKTLHAYFKHNGSLKDVAAGMFIHRHTLKYRLNRIQEISGLDLKSPDDRLTLQMALKVMPLLSGDSEDAKRPGENPRRGGPA